MTTTDNPAAYRDEVEAYEAVSLIPRIVTTSWDDGDACDNRIAEMLHRHKLPGTFYVPITGHQRSRVLGRGEMRALVSEGFEVGGHGFSHLVLPECTKELLIREVETSKQQLEDILGSKVSMFAYPRGRYSSAVIRSVKQAGYLGARTTEMLAQGFEYDAYRMPTTVQVFPHSKSEYLRNLARAADFGRAWRFIAELWQAGSWVDLAKALFDLTLAEGGVFHIYGHSWEIDELGLWNDLEEILNYVSGREYVVYIPNGCVLDYRGAKLHYHLESRALEE